ncbi:heat-inducible transcriptional repressor HrcA [Luteimonas mephitis]|uniref:heat-inducible transcriptional repressor HrcA n=1 Tax=Luteimonas mephitis TaxID=83615 RepID=UPI000424E7DD|nr:heat-inducible transcriptional repressor HrcA [Luteimonas mephitis]
MSRKIASQDALDPRTRQLLRALIGRYIRDGEPVGSQTLARHAGLDVSPATIRNILADLEEIGLLAAPHTSAGRIPTARGLRVFVDSLIEWRPPGERQIQLIHEGLAAQASTQEVLREASSRLSDISHFVGLVTVPRRDRFAFRHIDFVRLDERRVLAILVFTDGEVQNRAVEVPRPLSAGELEWIANYLNQNYAGLGLAEIRERLVAELDGERREVDRRMAATVALAQATLQPADDEDMLVSGQTKLMGGAQGLADVERLRELFEAFQRKSELLQVLEGCLRADGVRLFIGEESGVTSMEQCTLIAAPYASGGRVLGVLGVIGPTRMDYDRVITTVQATAQALSRTMAERVG